MAGKTSRSVRRLINSDSAATAIEYGLIAGLIALVVAGSLTQIGTGLTSIFANIAARF